jgi:hypothetical protein
LGSPVLAPARVSDEKYKAIRKLRDCLANGAPEVTWQPDSPSEVAAAKGQSRFQPSAFQPSLGVAEWDYRSGRPWVTEQT